MHIMKHILIRRLVPLLAILLGGTIMFSMVCADGAKHFHGVDPETDRGWNRVANRAYFTLTTMSSVGFGDVSPKSRTCRLVTSILLVAVTVQIVDAIAQGANAHNI